MTLTCCSRHGKQLFFFHAKVGTMNSPYHLACVSSCSCVRSGTIEIMSHREATLNDIGLFTKSMPCGSSFSFVKSRQTKLKTATSGDKLDQYCFPTYGKKWMQVCNSFVSVALTLTAFGRRKRETVDHPAARKSMLM